MNKLVFRFTKLWEHVKNALKQYCTRVKNCSKTILQVESFLQESKKKNEKKSEKKTSQ